MKLTLMQFASEGRVDEDHPPRVFPGHLNKEQCRKLAVEYGSGYPACHVDDGDNGVAFYACYSNDGSSPPEDDDDFYRWVENSKASLEVWFYHTTIKVSGQPGNEHEFGDDWNDETEDESVDGPTLVMTVGGLRRLLEGVGDDMQIQVAPVPNSVGWTNWILNALHQDEDKIVLGLSEGTCDCEEQRFTFRRDGKIVSPIE